MYPGFAVGLRAVMILSSENERLRWRPSDAASEIFTVTKPVLPDSATALNAAKTEVLKRVNELRVASTNPFARDVATLSGEVDRLKSDLHRSESDISLSHSQSQSQQQQSITSQLSGVKSQTNLLRSQYLSAWEKLRLATVPNIEWALSQLSTPANSAGSSTASTASAAAAVGTPSALVTASFKPV